MYRIKINLESSDKGIMLMSKENNIKIVLLRSDVGDTKWIDITENSGNLLKIKKEDSDVALTRFSSVNPDYFSKDSRNRINIINVEDNKEVNINET